MGSKQTEDLQECAMRTGWTGIMHCKAGKRDDVSRLSAVDAVVEPRTQIVYDFNIFPP